MPISPAREAAYRILSRVESGRDYAVDLLQSPQVAGLSEPDRALATEIVMGTLRRRGDLEYWVVKLSGKKLKYFDPEVATILRLSLYQILFLGKVPKSAVVNEAVELVKAAHKRSASGLVNAVLRKCEQPARGPRPRRTAGKAHEADAEARASGVRSLPTWLAERWERNFGRETMTSLADASLRVPHTTLRIVGDVAGREEVRIELLKEGISTRPGLYSAHALVVDSVGAGNVPSSPMVVEGHAVIQDEASQLVASLVAPQPGDRVLDLCAAPGIKAGQLASAMGPGLLVAGDLSARRLHTMRGLWPKAIPSERLKLVRLDAARELPFAIKFERVLVDAPCSGTGTLARNPEIKRRLEPKDLIRLAALQEKILQNALPFLAPGGLLVYATCSLEPEENEQIVERVFESQQGFSVVSALELTKEFPALSPLVDSRGYFRTRPDLHDMDGFFAAVIRATS